MWLLPNDRVRARVIRRQHRSMLKHVFMPRGAAWTTPELSGGAFWYPPGTTSLTFRETLAESLPFLPEGLPHMGRASRFEKAIKQRWPKEPHWYLSVLSISPEFQGQGHGTALLRPGLERVDADGTAAYLETQRERNVGFYEKFGFELVEKMTVDDEIPVWLMYREPAA